MSQNDSTTEGQSEDNESTMYLEVAENDVDGWRDTIHSFEGVVSFRYHRREGPELAEKVTIDMVNGHEEIKGRGYGLDVVAAEL